MIGQADWSSKFAHRQCVETKGLLECEQPFFVSYCSLTLLVIEIVMFKAQMSISTQTFCPYVVFQDSTGKKGLVATVDALVSGRMDSLERRKSNVSIIIAIITSVALVLTNLDKIGDFWNKTFGPHTQIEKKKKHRKVILSASDLE